MSKKRSWLLKGGIFYNSSTIKNNFEEELLTDDYGYYYKKLKEKYEKSDINNKERHHSKEFQSNLTLNQYKNFDRKYWNSFVDELNDFVDDINTIDFRKSKTQLKNVLTYELSIIIWKYISGDAKNKIFKTGKYKTDMTEDEIAREKQYALQQDLTNENRLHEQVNNSWKESNVRQLDLVDYINHKSLEERVQQGIIDGDTSEEHIKDYTKLLGES